jgi:RNA polymerase sigma-70 factor, ECF subfamily
MSQSGPSDADDVRRTLAGDREAFGRLFDRYARVVRAVVVTVSGDFGMVEDLTQETFLRAYRRLASLNDPEGFCGWIQGIARLVARERRREFAHDRRHFEVNDMRLVADDGCRDVVQQDEAQRLVLSAVAELPDRERLAVHAYFFQERSADEAASAVGLSRSGFYAALERGLNRLRRRLDDTSQVRASARIKR